MHGGAYPTACVRFLLPLTSTVHTQQARQRQVNRGVALQSVTERLTHEAKVRKMQKETRRQNFQAQQLSAHGFQPKISQTSDRLAMENPVFQTDFVSRQELLHQQKVPLHTRHTPVL